MAIDDNTLYGLNGAQVKELPGKIEAVKGLARELTTDDCNWPVSNPDGVAMWLLPEGMYSCDSATKVYPDNGASSVSYHLFFKFYSGGYSHMVYYDPGSYAWKYWIANTTTGARYQLGRITPEIINNLTSTDSGKTLSAAQGKVLKDLVDSNLGKAKVLTADDYNYPTGSPSSVALWLLEPGFYVGPSDASVNVTPYVGLNTGMGDGYPGNGVLVLKTATSSSRGGLAWFGGGEGESKLVYGIDINGQNSSSRRLDTAVVDSLTSTATTSALSANQGKALKDMIDALPTGSATVLTTADYNYPTDNPSCVALWLLEPGIYSWADDVAFRANSSWTNQTNSPGTSIIWDAGDGQLGMAFDYKGSAHWYQLASPTTGQSIWVNRSLLNTDVYQGGDYNKIRIGYATSSSGTRTTAIGNSASATGADAIAIGTSASATYARSVALGSGSSTSAIGEVAIGCNLGHHGYKNSNYRLLTGLYDPQSDHDAATKGYVDTAVAGAEAEEFTSNEWDAMWS